MEFRIAETFTQSLSRLKPQEQKLAKTTAFDLQMNPAHPGLQFHKLDRTKDKNFWSVRVNADIRLIVHRTGGSLLLCYVDHHDKAYAWAERRKLETHPKTGAAQLVEVRETVEEVRVPLYTADESPEDQPSSQASGPTLFAELSDEVLLGYGVPPDWVDDVRQADEEELLLLAERLPAEASEALLELATGGRPAPAKTAATAGADPFAHPDAQRRFRNITSNEELKQALEYPWEKWIVFLHPDQRQLVERNYNGPVRVSGSAGTGKTIVALHRAAFLARTSPESRVLLATFSQPLAYALRMKLRRLLGSEPTVAERIEVHSLDSLALRLHKAMLGHVTPASPQSVREVLGEAAQSVEGHEFSERFLLTEWRQVVDARQLKDWEDYRDVVRLGRKTRLAETKRRTLWAIFSEARAKLAARNEKTLAQIYFDLAEAYRQGKAAPYDFAVVDEAQDLGVAELQLFAAMAAGRENGLFFSGDLGQRIFQQLFSWKALGIEIRGRSHTLKVNYRTSHQIRWLADRLLDREVADADGYVEDRRGTVSVFGGPEPAIEVCRTEGEEIATVAKWLQDRSAEGCKPHELAVFVRSDAEVPRARAAAEASKLPFQVFDTQPDIVSGRLSVGTMHAAKGLEFRAVAVMACDDEVLPLQSRIEETGDTADLEEVYNTERHLFYVACTRARDHLLITGLEPVSEFIDDMTR